MVLSNFVWINLIRARKASSAVFEADVMPAKSDLSDVLRFFRNTQVCCQKTVTFGSNVEIIFDSDEGVFIKSDFTRF